MWLETLWFLLLTGSFRLQAESRKPSLTSTKLHQVESQLSTPTYISDSDRAKVIHQCVICEERKKGGRVELSRGTGEKELAELAEQKSEIGVVA